MIYRASPQRYRAAVASLEKTYRANPRRYRAVAASLLCQSTPSTHHSSVEIGDPHQSTRRQTSQAVEGIYRASPQRYRVTREDLLRQPATLPRRCGVTIVPVYAVVAPFQRRGK